jgi:hypothetical protein
MSYAALYTAFLPVLRRAGRWLIRRLVQWGLPRVITFMECRIDTFKDRRDRARTNRRKKWLTWRIAWRQRVIIWLKRHQAKLTTRIIKSFNRAYDAGLEAIPWDAVGERYATWVRRYAA